VLRQKTAIGKKVTVIGGGNSAIDAARTAKRMGAEVTVVYRRSREDMPAIPDEIEQALEEGAKLITMAAPFRIITDKTGASPAWRSPRPFPASSIPAAAARR
jgi:formate dehydrogenase beta subunit